MPVSCQAALPDDILRMRQLAHQISERPGAGKSQNGRDWDQCRDGRPDPLREHIGRADKEIMHAIQAETAFGQIGKGTANGRRGNPHLLHQQENGSRHQQRVRRTIGKEQLHPLLAHIRIGCHIAKTG